MHIFFGHSAKILPIKKSKREKTVCYLWI